MMMISRIKSSSTTRSLQYLVSSTSKSNLTVRRYCNNHKEDDEELEHIEKLSKKALKDDRFLDPKFYNEVDRKYSPELLEKFHKRLMDGKLLDVANTRKIAADLHMFDNYELLAPEETIEDELIESNEINNLKQAYQAITHQVKGKELEEALKESDGKVDVVDQLDDEVDIDDVIEDDDAVKELDGDEDNIALEGDDEIKDRDIEDIEDEDIEDEVDLYDYEDENVKTDIDINEEVEPAQILKALQVLRTTSPQEKCFEELIGRVESSENLPRGVLNEFLKQEWVKSSDQYTTLEQYLNEHMDTTASGIPGDTPLGITTRLQLNTALLSVEALYRERLNFLGIKTSDSDIDRHHGFAPLKYAENPRPLGSHEPHYVENDDTFDYNQHTSPNSSSPNQDDDIDQSHLASDPAFEAQFSQWMRERFIYKHKILNQLALAKTYEQIDNENVRESLSRSVVGPDEEDPFEAPMTDAELENAIRDIDGRVIPEELLDDRDRYNYLLRKYKIPAEMAKMEAEQREQRRAAMDAKKKEIDQFLESNPKVRRAALEEERLDARDQVDQILGADINIQKYKFDPKLEALREKKRQAAVKEKSSHEYLHRQIHRMEQQGELGNTPLYSPTTGKEITGNRKFPKCLLCYDFGWRVEPMNVPLLSIYLNTEGDILPRYITGNCLKHQKKLARNIKAAKHLGLFSYKSGTFTIYDPNVVPPTPKEEEEFMKYYKGAYTPKEWMDGDTRLQWEDDESNESLYAESEEEALLHKEALMLDLGISEAEAKEILSGKLESDGKEIEDTQEDSLDNPLNQ